MINTAEQPENNDQANDGLRGFPQTKFEEEFNEEKDLEFIREDKNKQMTRYQQKSKLDGITYDLVKYEVPDKNSDKYQEERDNILQILDLRHSNIIRYHAIYIWQNEDENQNDGDDNAIIVFVKQEHTQKSKCSLDIILEQTKQKFTQFECFEKLNDLYNALLYLKNKKKLNHGNINPHTILIDEYDHWKLCDFHQATKSFGGSTSGIAAKIDGSDPSHYHSPLKLKAIKSVQKVEFNAEKEDVWALGVIMLRCLSGKPDKDIVQLTFEKQKSQVCLKGLKPAVPGNYWKKIIQGMLEYEQDSRWDLNQLGENMLNGKIDL